MRLYVLLLYTCICFKQYAQLTKVDYYNKIDNKVYLFSKQKISSFDSVSFFINQNFSTNEDKVRAYYTWIALNVSYDTKRMAALDIIKNMNLRDVSDASQNADTVFKKKLAVCEGFSKLMVKFCKTSSIPSHMVIGYTKTPEGEIVTDILHAWNAVKIDGTWNLLDITWSNGYVNTMGEYTKRFSDKYFFSNPKEFEKDHLPLDPMWQCLNEPVSKNNFFNKDSSVIKMIFNYNDSIDEYFKANIAQQHYLDYLHYHQYDPTHPSYTHNLDVIVNNVAADYLGLASIYFNDYTDFYNTKLSKENTANNLKKAKTILEDAKVNIQNAIDYLKDKKAFTIEYSRVFKEMNESAMENLNIVKKNIEIITSAQKTTPKKSK